MTHTFSEFSDVCTECWMSLEEIVDRNLAICQGHLPVPQNFCSDAPVAKLASDFARDDDRNFFDSMRICYECHSTEAEFHAEACSKASKRRTIVFEESAWSEQSLDEVRFLHEIADDAVRERLANSYYDAEKARFRAARIARNRAEPPPTYHGNPGFAKRAWLTMAMERSEPAASISDLMRSPPTAMLSTAEPRRKRIP